MQVAMTPIGVVHSSRIEVGDDFWGGGTSVIELNAGVLEPEATRGLEEFSHVEVFFLMDRVDRESVTRGARHPRGNPGWPLTGILAQRARGRPNRIGATIARVLRVEGLSIEVEGLDAIDGTPVLDVKPVVREFLPRMPVEQPVWMTDLMKDYFQTPPPRSSRPPQ